jgi:hypothetical protein
MRRVALSLLILALVSFLPLQPIAAQTDPGVRGGDAAAGQPLASVAANNPLNILSFFNAGKADFIEVEDVPDGLGPRFNALSCGECHSQPAIGGTAPAINPQIAAATAEGATNTVPSFISAKWAGARGAVHLLFEFQRHSERELAQRRGGDAVHDHRPR